MRVYVTGLGSIGQRHLGHLRELGHDARGGRIEAIGGRPPDAMVIASPTSAHLEALAWCVEHRVHAYVEKPLAASSEGAAELLAAAEAAGIVVATGYNLRFHPALEAVHEAVASGRFGRLLSARAEVGHYLPDWHPDVDYRRTTPARRDRGGGALLTLSHELDYVRWIAGEVVDCRGVVARVSSLELDVDDVAELVLRHESGAVSSVHADMVDREYNRRSRWLCEAGTVAWSWGGPVTAAGTTLWRDDAFDLEQTYVAALRDFLRAAESGAAPRGSGRDGLRVVELCEAVAQAPVRA